MRYSVLAVVCLELCMSQSHVVKQQCKGESLWSHRRRNRKRSPVLLTTENGEGRGYEGLGHRFGHWSQTVGSCKPMISYGTSPSSFSPLLVSLPGFFFTLYTIWMGGCPGVGVVLFLSLCARRERLRAMYKETLSYEEQIEICHFTQRNSTLSFPKICNTFWRFHHTSTSHWCSCSKTVSNEKYQDPFQLGRKDLKNLYEDIKKELLVSAAELKEMCDYYFDGKGKAFRPMIVVLMARACNIHHNNSREVQASQRSVAIIAEMIHTASLVHDDVIDDANSRRGKMTVNQIWGERKAVLAGDFILSAASVALARIGNTTIISVLTQVIEDLVRGEFLQLGSKENENERFAHYLEKTFKKTASLIANSCKAVSILGCPDPKVHEIAYQYGKNVGIAFQLIDDVLDFTSCADHLGKPAAADLKLGLATGPVLFACRQFPEMNAMIMRRFSKPGDVERARKYVLQSDGVQQTTYLAQRYCHEATREISKLRPSPEREALIQLTEMVLTRDK